MSDKPIIKEEPFPVEWKGRQVGLLDALLWGRHQVRVRHALWLVTGLGTVDSILPFVHGWNANLQFNGGEDLAWWEFRAWLRDERGMPLLEDWYVEPLRRHQGDHERVALMLLDSVAEYVSRFGAVPSGKTSFRDVKRAFDGPLSQDWIGREVGLLDVLIWVRQQLCEGRALSFLTGSETIGSLYAFTIGWSSQLDFNKREEPALERFQDWLRDVKKEFPGQGWHVKYLEDCQGNHREATLKFLDFAAEFLSAR